jgi:hypothetical protein
MFKSNLLLYGEDMQKKKEIADFYNKYIKEIHNVAKKTKAQ